MTEIWHHVAADADLPAGEVLEVVAAGIMVALGRTETGELFAIDGICAHQGGPLGKGQLEGCTLTCPWHGWQYDVSTGKHTLSETIAQRGFAVRVVAGRIEVSVD